MGQVTRGGPLSRTFWVLWIASTASFLGEGALVGALPLLAASLTRDPRLVSLTEAVGQAGWLLLGLVAGVYVDRWSRTAVMWRADALRATVAAGFAVVVITGVASVPLVLGFGFLLGLIAPFFDNASAAVLPEIVEDRSLERANSLNQTSILLSANLLGPPIGAALFVWAPELPFVLQAVALMIGAGLVFTVRRATSVPPRRADRHLGRELRAGLSFLWRNRLLRTLCLLLMLINGASTAIIAVLVLYVLELLKLPEAAYGWLIAVFAVGGLLGALVAPRVSRTLGTTTVVVGSAIVMGLGIGGLGAWPQTAFVVVCVLVCGVVSVLWNVTTLSIRQRLVPTELQGRVTSVYRVVAFAAMPLGAGVAGIVAHAWGLRAPYLGAGVLMVLAAVVAIPAVRTHAGSLRTQVSERERAPG